jgi:3-oxoacyl-[acyl-carrier-protein] synthase-1
MRRVVITGSGIVSCIGNNKKEVLRSLLNTKSGKLFPKNTKNIILKVKCCGVPNIKYEN